MARSSGAISTTLFLIDPFMSIKTYQVLKSVGLSDQRVTRMLVASKSETFAVDQVVWPKGASLQPLTLIVTGLVCACVPDADGGLNPVNIYGPGAWFGEAAILNHQASSVEYVCLSPARVVAIPLAEALDAFECEAEFSRYIARLVTWRSQQHAEMLTLMRTGSPALRVVMGLALFAEAMASSSSHLPHFELEDSLDIPLKQSLLASMCGVSRGIFSVCVKQLAAAGLLRVNYATVALVGLKTWGRFSNAHRQSRLNLVKPSMQALLSLLQAASVDDLALAQDRRLAT